MTAGGGRCGSEEGVLKQKAASSHGGGDKILYNRFPGAAAEGGYWGDRVRDEHVRKSDRNVMNVILYI